jgi:hypothetical protein
MAARLVLTLAALTVAAALATPIAEAQPAAAKKEQLLQVMAREPDEKKRLATWEKVQTRFYAEAARIEVDDFRLDARRKEVQGDAHGPYMHFWNVWLDRR